MVFASTVLYNQIVFDLFPTVAGSLRTPIFANAKIARSSRGFGIYNYLARPKN
jgi:hypothetical protein